MPKYQDPKTGKFISEAEARERGIEAVGGIKYHEAIDDYFKKQAKESGKTEKQIAEELLSQQFAVVEFDEATGTACLKLHSFGTATKLSDMSCAKLAAEYKDLREHFPPVSAGIEYHKTFLCGSGFEVECDDPADKHKLQMRDEIRKWCRETYFDYYRRGVDKILYMVSDDLLTHGVVGSEIIYGRNIEFEEFATKKPTKDGYVWDVRLVQEVKNSEWKSFKGIKRLKILDNIKCRIKPVVDTQSIEFLYWLLDPKTDSSIADEVRQSVGLSKETDEEAKKLLPWQVFWLSWNTRGTNLKGESIIRPVLEISRMVRKILISLGQGFERWANRKYFFVCGTDKRPWNKQAIKSFLKYLELMVKHKWTGVPVPQGFDIKEIGGDVFEGTELLNYLIGLICAGMNYPLDFLESGRTREGDNSWLAWQVKYGANQRQLRRDIEHQLFQKHLWCKYGRTYKKPVQNVKPKKRKKVDIYIPKIIWNAEGRWQRKEEMETLQKWLNVANPIGAEFKLALEMRAAELLGFGEIQFPSFNEIRREMKRMAKQDELMLKEQLKKRQIGGVSIKPAPTGKDKKPPPKAGRSRHPKLKKKGMPSKSFGESTEFSEMKESIEDAVKKSLSNVSLPSIPIEITVKSTPSEPTKVDVTVKSEPNQEVIKEKITTEKEKQETVRKIRERLGD